jgi:uncharacterized membrane protein
VNQLILFTVFVFVLTGMPRLAKLLLLVAIFLETYFAGFGNSRFDSAVLSCAQLQGRRI